MRSEPLFLTALIMLASCTVGPDYAGPPVVTSPADRFARAGDATPPLPAVARWWTALRDPTLDALVTRALANSPSIAVAEARLRQARASLRREKADALPDVNATALYAHARIPGLDLADTGSPDGATSVDASSDRTTKLDLYNVGFDASWEADLFGGRRRAVEAARANAGTAQANLADAQVSLVADVADAYVNLRERQRRIAFSARSVSMQERMLALTRQRFERGTASRLDLARMQNQLDGTRADAVPLSAERDAYLDVLAVLTGNRPGALDRPLAALATIPLPPVSVPIDDPTALIARRPDVRAAERTLAARTAKIGQAEAARYPAIKFMGIVGLGGTDPSDLTKLDDFTAFLAPQLSWSFLDFGRNRARIVSADAARDEAEAQYRQTILAALRDAEDALSRFRNRRVEVATLARAARSADEAVALSEERYRAGTMTLIDLLEVRRQQIAAAQGLAHGEAALTGDFIAIQKALGLGWANA